MKQHLFQIVMCLIWTFLSAGCAAKKKSSPTVDDHQKKELPQISGQVDADDAFGENIYSSDAVKNINQGTSISRSRSSQSSNSNSNNTNDSAGKAGLPDDINTVPSSGRTISATYFTEWSIYGRGYEVNQIPGEKLTHILYGFIPICGDASEDYWNKSLKDVGSTGYSALVKECTGKQPGEITIHDRFAALEKSFDGDTFDQPLKGNFHQLALLKEKHPHLKVVPSIGGWTLSDPFFYLVKNPTARANFLNSIKSFLITYPMFDGIDIDWEFPGGGGANSELGSPDDGVEFAKLMQDIRRVLDEIQPENKDRYELTAAIGASPEKIRRVDYESAHPYMDYIFLMSYDYYGAWNTQTGHMTGLFEGDNAISEGFDTDNSVQILNEQVPANKIVLGYAAYGRGWKGVNGQSGDDPFSAKEYTCNLGSCAIAGTWEAGVLDYKDIAENYLNKNGFVYGYDQKAEAPYLWNSVTGELISYDDPTSIQAKANYAKQKGLAGMFSWSIDSDDGSLINTVIDVLGPLQ
ncbi:MAG: glycoside hydrolase family 18 protein [Oligoflexales bacterium]